MRNTALFKKALCIVGFLAFFGAGYLALSVNTSCPAQAQACNCGLCVYQGPGSMSVTVSEIYSLVTVPGVGIATATLTTYFSVTMTSFNSSVLSKIFQVTRNLHSFFDTFWSYNLLPAMQAQTIQYNVADADQARVIGALGDAVDANRTHMAMQKVDLESQEQVRPSDTGCVPATIVGGMGRAYAFRTGYGAAAPAEKLGRTTGARGSPGERGPQYDVAARWDRYVELYCDSTANGGAAGCTSNGSRVDRDLDVTGEIFMKDTINLPDRTVKSTVDDLIENIAEPFIPAPPQPGTLNSPQYVEEALAMDSYATRRQVVYDALYHVVGRRLPGSMMGDYLAPMRAAAGFCTAENAGQGGCTAANAITLSENPSHNEIMEVMMNERFRTGSYAVSQVDEPENNMREMVIQQAFAAMQMSDNLDLLDKYAMLIAAQAAADVNREFAPRMPGE